VGVTLVAITSCTSKVISRSGFCGFSPPAVGSDICSQLQQNLPVKIPDTQCTSGKCQKLNQVPNPYKPLKQNYTVSIKTCTLTVQVTGEFTATGEIGTCC
jgi:hypothetical protein